MKGVLQLAAQRDSPGKWQPDKLLPLTAKHQASCLVRLRDAEVLVQLKQHRQRIRAMQGHLQKTAHNACMINTA
jgi:hypothetical protein